MAHDKRNIYFYVECAESLTPADGEAWMRLFIDADRSRESGWEGYDYIVNRIPNSIERNVGGWQWQGANPIKMLHSGTKMELAIPLAVLGVKSGEDFELEFKWVDNTQSEGDVYDFYLSGDAAPLGRFNYLYRAK